eukprot:13487031-Alexandrium_andersonii.AAC.1
MAWMRLSRRSGLSVSTSGRRRARSRCRPAGRHCPVVGPGCGSTPSSARSRSQPPLGSSRSAGCWSTRTGASARCPLCSSPSPPPSRPMRPSTAGR